MDHYDNATDEDLVGAARSGDDRALDALLLRYRRVVRATAASYFLAGAERDDLVQEGMIGLYKAVLDFDPGAGARFRPFAGLCVSRQLVSAVKAANRHKHRPLNDYVSIHRPLTAGEEDECTLADVLPAAPHTDPAEQVLLAERIRALECHLDSALSDLETQVLQLHVDGRSYREIAGAMRRHAKSIDNALQRIKRKVDAHLVEWETTAA